MADTAENLFVARESDIQALRAHLDAARQGDGRMVVVSAPMAGGKRPLVNELVRIAAGIPDDDVLVWRTALSDEEDGLRTLVRLYASLYQVLHRAPLLKTKVEMVLNAQMPQHTQRVQAWLQTFIEGLKKSPKPGEETFQVSLPRDNPLAGLVEIIHAVASKVTVLMELQNVHQVHSVGFFAFVEALLDASRGRSRLCAILTTEQVDDKTAAYLPAPWEDFLNRRKADFHAMELVPWGDDEVAAYLASKGLQGNVTRIREISHGMPGFVGELVDYLQAEGRLQDGLEGVTLANLTPTAVDEDELDEGEATTAGDAEAAEGKRRKATVTDAPLVQHVAALLGHVFPSTLVADMCGFERDSVDDLLDASGDLFQEMQFNESIQSWLYSFKRGLFRFGVLELNDTDEGRARTVRVGQLMERFLAPRGYEFLVKTMRVYGEAREPRRTVLLRSMALSNDVPDMWLMAHDALKYYDDVPWSAPMRRTVFLSLLERLVLVGTVEMAEKLYDEAMAWADENDDRPMKAQVLFAGSRLDHRRQDLYRSRDRAKDALTLFKALDARYKAAEVWNHIASIELADGNGNAALDAVKAALELADAPPIVANAEFVKGLVSKRDRKYDEAIEAFRKANEVAGGAGLGPLALEAGINLGECQLMAQQPARAADVLTRCVQISQALRNPQRERIATALLAQAHAAQQHWQAAMGSAKHTLDLTKKLKLDRFLAVDTYNVGFFAFQSGSANEATSLFRQALQTATPQEPSLYKEIQFHLGLALKQVGEMREARTAFQACLEPAARVKDVRRLVEAQGEISDILVSEGDLNNARKVLKQGIASAEAANLRDLRKGLKRKLDALEG